MPACSSLAAAAPTLSELDTNLERGASEPLPVPATDASIAADARRLLITLSYYDSASSTNKYLAIQRCL